MAPRLKVFTWSDGLHAYTVAASSRPKALAAWGIEGDIFATGLASEIKDGPDHEAALKAPGEVIKRGMAVDIGEVSSVKPKTAAGSSKAARDRVKALEADLADLDTQQTEETAELERRRAALDAKAAELAKRQTKARDTLVARLKAARRKL